jgi:hypothetical protein
MIVLLSNYKKPELPGIEYQSSKIKLKTKENKYNIIVA